MSILVVGAVVLAIINLVAAAFLYRLLWREWRDSAARERRAHPLRSVATDEVDLAIKDFISEVRG